MIIPVPLARLYPYVRVTVTVPAMVRARRDDKDHSGIWSVVISGESVVEFIDMAHENWPGCQIRITASPRPEEDSHENDFDD